MSDPVMGPDEQYCFSCGSVVKKAAEICPRCGVRRLPPPAAPATSPPVPPNSREWLVTLLLCIFLGTMGVHRFYTGHILIGLLQLITCGCCGIWWLIDLILIVTDSYTDAEGKPLVKR